MGSKPNWAAGLQALGQTLNQYAMMQYRQEQEAARIKAQTDAWTEYREAGWKRQKEERDALAGERLKAEEAAAVMGPLYPGIDAQMTALEGAVPGFDRRLADDPLARVAHLPVAAGRRDAMQQAAGIKILGGLIESPDTPDEAGTLSIQYPNGGPLMTGLTPPEYRLHYGTLNPPERSDPGLLDQGRVRDAAEDAAMAVAGEYTQRTVDDVFSNYFMKQGRVVTRAIEGQYGEDAQAAAHKIAGDVAVSTNGQGPGFPEFDAEFARRWDQYMISNELGDLMDDVNIDGLTAEYGEDGELLGLRTEKGFWGGTSLETLGGVAKALRGIKNAGGLSPTMVRSIEKELGLTSSELYAILKGDLGDPSLGATWLDAGATATVQPDTTATQRRPSDGGRIKILNPGG